VVTCPTCEIDARAVLVDEVTAANQALIAGRNSLEHDLGQLDHENTVLVEQWHEVAVRLDNYEANHGAQCDAEQERYATIAESALRTITEAAGSLLPVVVHDRRHASDIREAARAVFRSLTTFGTCPDHQVQGLRAQVAASAERIAELLATAGAARTVCEELLEQLRLSNQTSDGYRDSHMAYQRWASRLAPDAVGDDAKREAIGASTAEVVRLTERRDALLAFVWNASQSTPLAVELEGWEGQRAALLAEVGTLRAQVAERDRTIKFLRYYEIPDDTIKTLTDKLAEEAKDLEIECLVEDAIMNLEQLRKQRDEARAECDHWRAEAETRSP
jgi:hypothetical protein